MRKQIGSETCGFFRMGYKGMPQRGFWTANFGLEHWSVESSHVGMLIADFVLEYL
jgi:hypothetical protein